MGDITPVPVTVDNALTVSDLSRTTLASGTVSITGNFTSSQDVLGFTNVPATMGNIAGSYNSGTGVLSLTSSGSTVAGSPGIGHLRQYEQRVANDSQPHDCLYTE